MAVVVGVFASPAEALEVPPLTGRIVDTAHLLPADLAASLSAELAAHEERTSNQVVLLTLPSLEGEPLEEYSQRVATIWKLGQKGTDNGVLMVVVPVDRKVRIEVGYGLEGTLTDAMSSRIIRAEMVPRFRSGDFAGGIAAGLKAVMGTIEGTYTPAERERGASGNAANWAWDIFFIAVVVGALAGAIIGAQRKGTGGLIGGAITFFLALSSGWILAMVAAVIAMILILVVSGLPSGVRRSSYSGFGGGWGGLGDFSGGGSFGGGGGGFGGGGASGSW